MKMAEIGARVVLVGRSVATVMLSGQSIVATE
jgi:hypothetical protein